MSDLQNVFALENSVKEMIQTLKAKLIDEIYHTPIPDVISIAPNMAIVRFSKLQHNILTPEYYIAETQANYVRRTLDGVVTAHVFIERINKMIDKRGTVINSVFYPLNDTTIQILKKYID